MAVCPGATEARLHLERELRERGWPLAAGPAAADVLAVVGNPDPADTRWSEGLWAAIPAPRARIHLMTAQEVGMALDEVATVLLHTPPTSPAPSVSGQSHNAPATRPEHRAPDQDHSAEAHAGHDMHGGHMSHDMGMEVGGLPMADRADDRDGLRLDQLHLCLGPALLDWPAGLVLRLALQGDVIQHVRVERTRVRSGSGLPFWDEPWLRAAAGEQVSRGQAARRLCAAHLDSVGRLLAVAGWRAEAQRARTARDVALSGRPAEDVVGALKPLVRRVGRSRTLRWLTAGLGELSSETATAAGLSGPALVAGGDVWSRLTLWLGEAARAAALCDKTGEVLDSGPRQHGPRGVVGGALPPSQALLDVMPGLLEGAEFAGVRLIVASLDPDLDELVPCASEPLHG